MKSFKSRIIFLALAALALFISNPKLSTHKDKIVEKFKQENPISGKLGAGDLIKEVIAYDDYYLFSLGKISITGDPVSFGIAGFVIVFASLDLAKYKDMVPKELKDFTL